MRAYWEWKHTIGEILAASGIIVSVLFVVLLFAYTLVLGWNKGRTQSACLERGYAEFRVDWTLTAYCVQRDYRGVMKAIPLEELR